MKDFLVQRWFLLALVLLLSGGIVLAEPLHPISEWSWLRDAIVVIVMFCMSLTFEGTRMWGSIKNPGPPLLAIGVTYGILPLVAWSVSLLLPGDLRPGLQVAAATPCTLASAAFWTRRAGGNETVALLVTLVTNATCFFVTPLWLLVMTGYRAASPDLTLARLASMLAALVVLPILAAQLARRRQSVVDLASRYRVPLGVVAQCGILAMIFLGAIHTGLGLQERTRAVAVTDLLLMFAAVLGVHLSMFWLGVLIARLLQYPPADQIAVGIAGSQKTLTVGILMAIALQASVLPMITYHCLQLFVDTLIVDAYRKAQSG